MLFFFNFLLVSIFIHIADSRFRSTGLRNSRISYQNRNYQTRTRNSERKSRISTSRQTSLQNGHYGTRTRNNAAMRDWANQWINQKIVLESLQKSNLHYSTKHDDDSDEPEPYYKLRGKSTENKPEAIEDAVAGSESQSKSIETEHPIEATTPQPMPECSTVCDLRYIVISWPDKYLCRTWKNKRVWCKGKPTALSTTTAEPTTEQPTAADQSPDQSAHQSPDDNKLLYGLMSMFIDTLKFSAESSIETTDPPTTPKPSTTATHLTQTISRRQIELPIEPSTIAIHEVELTETCPPPPIPHNGICEQKTYSAGSAANCSCREGYRRLNPQLDLLCVRFYSRNNTLSWYGEVPLCF
ncbi:hypothetical protein Ddc_16416 [Ditylenchus destructor]|nr:hypothetical protein Ddc_16416 [Ditylenchus destructor]